jgi:hypothetical protein
VKISGEGLMGPGEYGLHGETVLKLARDIKAVTASGRQVCLVIGGAAASTLKGYSGQGYAAITDAKGGTLTWTYTAAESGMYSLGIRYAMEAGTTPATLTVNGAVVDRSLSLWATGGASTWQTETRSVVLKKGANTITLTTTNKVPAIDLLSISKSESRIQTRPEQR